MLPTSITLIVVTPEREVVREEVAEVQIPGARGYLGILPGHAPLITELGMGELSYKKDGQSSSMAAINGYSEVLPDRVTVLAERAEPAEEIDVERAQAARDRAQGLLSKPGDPEVNWERATFALQRALLRLQVATKGGAVAAAHDEHGAAH